MVALDSENRPFCAQILQRSYPLALNITRCETKRRIARSSAFEDVPLLTADAEFSPHLVWTTCCLLDPSFFRGSSVLQTWGRRHCMRALSMELQTDLRAFYETDAWRHMVECSPRELLRANAGKEEFDEDGDVWALLEGTAAGAGESSDEEPCAERFLSCPMPLGRGTSALREAGISIFEIPPETYAPLQGLAEALLRPTAWKSVLATESGQELQLGPGWPRLRLHNSVGSDRLLWVYAGDEGAMAPFDTLAEALASQVATGALGDTRLRLCAGSLVVLRAPGARNSEVFAHRDWDVPELPPRSAFTALVPLVLPHESAGLEVFDEHRSLLGVAKYALGEAIAFDNMLLHRSQPGRSPTRILASLSFAPTTPELWPAAERVLRAQTPFFYRRLN